MCSDLASSHHPGAAASAAFSPERILTRRKLLAGVGGLLAAPALAMASAAATETHPERAFGCRVDVAPGPAPASRASAVAATSPRPVLAGIPWYERFDTPVERTGAFWIGLGREWGSVRAGHAVCLRPPALRDPRGAWEHYDQGASCAAVGFAASRAASLLTQRLYDGVRMYEAAQRYDQWNGENYDGTTIEAGLAALVAEGPWPVRQSITQPIRADAIKSWRWALTVEEILAALGSGEEFVRVLSSWGTAFPREVRLPLRAIERLLAESSQFGVAIGRVPV
jgi:hypothetical protein